MACFRYITVNTLHQGDNKDDDHDNMQHLKKFSPEQNSNLWDTVMHNDSYVPTFWRNLLSLFTGQDILLCTPEDEGNGFLQNLSHPLTDIFKCGKPLYRFLTHHILDGCLKTLHTLIILTQRNMHVGVNMWTHCMIYQHQKFNSPTDTTADSTKHQHTGQTWHLHLNRSIS
jgi:hypothetical protein